MPWGAVRSVTLCRSRPGRARRGRARLRGGASRPASHELKHVTPPRHCQTGVRRGGVATPGAVMPARVTLTVVHPVKRARYDRHMPRTRFETIPPQARLWIFAAERALTPRERDYLLGTVDDFLDRWQAHGQPLTSARDFRYDQFLFIAVDESAAGASGCSIDTLVRDIKAVERTLGVTLVDHGPILFRDGVSIVRLPRDEFAERARAGTVTPDTVVFNNALTRVKELSENRWEGPAARSWHGAAFF
jgi:hypothetical protein